MNLDFPKTVEIQGVEYDIRSDYRVAKDIFAALSDPELSDQERSYVVLNMFYPNFKKMPVEHYKEALEWCMWFIKGGEDDDGSNTKSPKLVDWEQDFKLMVAPINHVLGFEIREAEYLHWWSFLSGYYEISGDSTFAQVVSIRSKLAHKKKLDKTDREFLNRNRKLVEFKNKYTESENELLKAWGKTK